MIDISSLSVSSSTWQYKSIVICNELWPSNFCKVFGRIPFAIQFVAKVCLKQCGVNLSNFSVGFWALIRSTIYSIELRILLSWIGRFVLLVNTKSSNPCCGWNLVVTSSCHILCSCNTSFTCFDIGIFLFPALLLVDEIRISLFRCLANSTVFSCIIIALQLLRQKKQEPPRPKFGFLPQPSTHRQCPCV